METHRCPGSLEQEVSIRHDKRYEGYRDYAPAWNLRTLEHDSEYGSIFPRYRCEIAYCPFCGKKLE